VKYSFLMLFISFALLLPDMAHAVLSDQEKEAIHKLRHMLKTGPVVQEDTDHSSGSTIESWKKEVNELSQVVLHSFKKYTAESKELSEQTRKIIEEHRAFIDSWNASFNDQIDGQGEQAV